MMFVQKDRKWAAALRSNIDLFQGFFIFHAVVRPRLWRPCISGAAGGDIGFVWVLAFSVGGGVFSS